MKKIIFATHNVHKLQEIREILTFGYTVLSLTDIGFDQSIDETGLTFYDNALIKANTIYTQTGYDCFADDSGLMVDSLNGNPGVFSARFAGPNANDEMNRKKLLLEMNGVKKRTSSFHTVICLIIDKEKYFFEGKISGTIAVEEKGSGGFGYDPIFIPQGYQITFAEMNSEQKNTISHRAIAVKKMVDFLRSR